MIERQRQGAGDDDRRAAPPRQILGAGERGVDARPRCAASATTSARPAFRSSPGARSSGLLSAEVPSSR